MADFGFTPNLIASGAIAPFRFVELATTAPFTGKQADAATDLIVGVTDGSIRRFDAAATSNAATGDQITLQPTNTVQVEAGASFNIGAALTSDSSGRAIVGVQGNTCFYIALEAASAAGEIVRAFRFGTRVVA
jgi:hypothetical protein